MSIRDVCLPRICRAVSASAILCFLSGVSNGAPLPPSYPYEGKAFSEFVQESFKIRGGGSAKTFYAWFDAEVRRATGKTADAWVSAQRRLLRSAKNKTEAERLFGASVHRLIKQTIRKFSLDRGFEFAYTVSKGERQCLLQSVLIAGLAQRAGLAAGTAMVWSNEQGQTSNLGHVVSVLALDNGHHLLVDASEPQPFAKHRGLLLRVAKGADYRFVVPVYSTSGSEDEIVGYATPDQARSLAPKELGLLDVPFLRSQFDFYRGEREPGGLLAENPTATGLAASERYLRKAMGECTKNPLVVYSVGRACDRQKKTEDARKAFAQAYALYKRFGWIPDGPKKAAGF